MELNLDEIRKEISDINDNMLSLFIKRMELSAKVAEYKKAHDLPTLDRKREEAILQKVADSTPEEYREYALNLFKYLIYLSKEYQDSLK